MEKTKINMEFKGTKTDWKLAGNDKTFVYALNSFGTNSFSLLLNNDGKISIEEQKANALLISKAPEMLEILIDAVNEKKSGCNVSDGWYIRVEKLIKEATEL